ncbi:molybdopterin biosynthesis protein [Aerophototrophica crusticola]|uniref:Molybdopterin molybdenumtransferase n=1 Tax=Aerophototrophica crusticola TaxID=1709002 RepID=A0A858R7E0_9PROT|nr:molybdopterin biosynthesis protein [Rhodospirillaceae bacterium B3]
MPTTDPPFLRRVASQDQFLEVVPREEANRRFHAHLTLAPLPAEHVPLSADLLGRVLAADVVAPLDVPQFDRSGVDGFAVRATDTSGATDHSPVTLRLNGEVLACGVAPVQEVLPGTATVIATGGMVPRGADAVVMVEHTDYREGPDGTPLVDIRKPASPGSFVAFAGSDIGRGEVVLRRGTVLTSRELGVLAALGLTRVGVVRRPRVAILSTGDELLAPGEPMRPGAVYDSNAAILAAAVAEAGGEPVPLGIARDRETEIAAKVEQGLEADMLVLSGGTSKGAGDISYRIIGGLGEPGIVVHGVAIKPGKPVALGVVRGKPVVLLPGFPTSAIFTFHEFVAPVIRALAGLKPAAADTVQATLPVRALSERGRAEYVMVSLVDTPAGLAAYPTAKGSGAVTSFAQADGFFCVPQGVEAVEAGTRVTVQRIGRDLEPASLSIIGSHCVGLDLLVGELAGQGIGVKLLNVGSMGGLAAARRGECDIAPIHLMDPRTGTYNTPFLAEGLTLARGYGRRQGIVFRKGDGRFEGRAAAEALAAALADPDCRMVNRNAGAGTRILLDRLLAGAKPPGYWAQAKSHNAVAAAVAQGRADWGMAIDTVAEPYGLGFLPVQPERYDFAIPADRLDRPSVRRFLDLLANASVRRRLTELGFDLTEDA